MDAEEVSGDRTRANTLVSDGESWRAGVRVASQTRSIHVTVTHHAGPRRAEAAVQCTHASSSGCRHYIRIARGGLSIHGLRSRT